MSLSIGRLIVSILPIALFGCGMATHQVPPASMGAGSANETEEPDEGDTALPTEETAPRSDEMAASETEEGDDQVMPAEAAVGVEEAYLEFVYDWPDALNAYAPLAAYFREQADAELADIRGYMAEDERLTDPDEQFRPEYSSNTVWEIRGTSGPLISLAADFYKYSGGAHGIYGTNALLYDRQAGKVVKPADLFADPVAAREAIQPVFCQLLDKERSRRRGGEQPGSGDFWECIDPLEQTLIFHPGRHGTAFDRLIVYAGPYAAGAYAEGDFTIELPVTAELREAIEPGYRNQFEVGGEASVIIKP